MIANSYSNNPKEAKRIILQQLYQQNKLDSEVHKCQVKKWEHIILCLENHTKDSLPSKKQINGVSYEISLKNFSSLKLRPDSDTNIYKLQLDQIQKSLYVIFKYLQKNGK